jgi:hypothetical protein
MYFFFLYKESFCIFILRKKAVSKVFLSLFYLYPNAPSPPSFELGGIACGKVSPVGGSVP